MIDPRQLAISLLHGTRHKSVTSTNSSQSCSPRPTASPRYNALSSASSRLRRLLLELYANEIGEKPEQVLRPIAIRPDERRGALPAPSSLTSTPSGYYRAKLYSWTFSGGHRRAGEWRRSGRSMPVRRLGYGL